MDIETIAALQEISGDGFWAVFFFSLFRSLPELIMVIALILGVRTVWKKMTEEDNKEN